jgi:hypothetical protein
MPDNRGRFNLCCKHCENAGEDHDLLTGMNTKLDAVLASLKDHESRIRRLETYCYMVLGAIGLIKLIGYFKGGD